MIEPLRSRLVTGERPPFEHGGRRLRITVYCPNSDELSTNEEFALGFIRELARLDSLRVVDTDSGAPWRMVVDAESKGRGVASVVFVGPEDRRVYCAFHPRDWIDEAIHLRRFGSRTDGRTRALASHLPVLEAHRQTHRDLFITTERELLQRRARVSDANVTDVFGGLKLIGLYLRSQRVFTIRVWDRGKENLDRGLFYWILCRNRLPAMWRYFAACVHRGHATHDGMEYLGSAILDRCVRVLQARDEVGFEFYKEQDNSTRDGMLYHFDYLTLMLSGALDVLARIAREVYVVTNVSKRETSFRNRRFRQAIKTGGAKSLMAVLNDPFFKNFQRLLGALRNTVHSTGLRGVGVIHAGQPQSSIVRVFEDAQEVWDASNALGSPDNFGVTKVNYVAIEPYTCAVRLCELGLHYVNEIAQGSDVGRLLPPNQPISDLLNGPPDDGLFRAEIRRRVDALG